jgi:hypothetical protein
LDTFDDTAFHVIFQQKLANATERGLCRRDLIKDIVAIGILID